MSDLMELGDRLEKAIKESPYSAKEVATDAGVSPQAVSKAIRSGSMSKDNLRKIAAFTGVNQDWLINGKSKADAVFNEELMTECIMALKEVVKERGMTNISEEDILNLGLRLYKANL